MSKKVKLNKRTHDQRIRMLENTVLNLHDNILPAMTNAVAERDSVIHACVLQLHKLDPSRKLMKVAGAEGSFYLFTNEEEIEERRKEEEEAAAARAAAVDTEEQGSDTSKG